MVVAWSAFAMSVAAIVVSLMALDLATRDRRRKS
jgi:hypothetical protein